MNLEEADASAWSSLEAATADPQSGFRFINLCTVDAAGRPQARMVVLRRVDTAARHLEIHTDTRSRKWIELSRNPVVTILGFCASTRVQLRLVGSAHLHAPGSDDAKKENWIIAVQGAKRQPFRDETQLEHMQPISDVVRLNDYYFTCDSSRFYFTLRRRTRVSSSDR